MRLFAAIPLPESTRAALAAWSASSGPRPGLRWTPAEQLHITLKFLGDVADDRVGRIVEALDGIAARGFTVELERLELLGRAGVLAAAAKPAPSLSRLAGEVRSRLASFAEDPEEREFHPHITLARARRGSRVPKAHSLPPLPALEFTATCLRLYRSQTRPEGAVYSVIQEWLLQVSAAES